MVNPNMNCRVSQVNFPLYNRTEKLIATKTNVNRIGVKLSKIYDVILESTFSTISDDIWNNQEKSYRAKIDMIFSFFWVI